MSTETSTTEHDGTPRISEVPGHGPDGVPTTCTDPSCQEALAAGAEWMDAFMSTLPTPEGMHAATFHHTERLHEVVAENTRAEFEEIAQRYAQNPEEFYASYHYLRLHPIFHRYEYRTAGEIPNLDTVSAEELAAFETPRHLVDDDGWRDVWMSVVLVDPATKRVEDDSSRNTHTEVWLEHGPHLFGSDVFGSEYAWQFQITGHSTHDHEIDCGGDTFEEAVIALAANVHTRYGNDRSKVNE